MAGHTDLGSWHTGKRALVDCRVTVATVDTQATHVVLMAKRHRLSARHPFLRGVTRPVEGRQKPQESGKDKNSTKDAQSSKGIGAGMKDLRHDCITDLGETTRLLTALKFYGLNDQASCQIETRRMR
jgi:hypothetical protein